MPMVLCIRKTDIPNIRFDMHTAWASALLILGQRQCESLVRGMSDEFRFPRFFYVDLGYNRSNSAQGVRGGA